MTDYCVPMTDDERVRDLGRELAINHPHVAANIARGLVARIHSDAAELARLRAEIEQLRSQLTAGQKP